MKRSRLLLFCLVILLPLGCQSDEPDMATRTEETIGKAKSKAEELKEQENQRVEELNEAIDQ